MSTTAEIEPTTDDSQDLHYRTLSSLAVFSIACGVLSILALFDLSLGLIPAIGILTGIRALRQIHRTPDELAGGWLAKMGIALSLLLLVSGWARISYIRAMEVPDGYLRISYEQLQPDPNTAGQTVPQSALDLDGQHIFIKGYVYPGSQKTGIKRFVLCRDNGTCCFGGQPKVTDMIQVTLADPLSLDYSPNIHRLAGTFHVEPSQASDQRGTVLYQLDADYLK